MWSCYANGHLGACILYEFDGDAGCGSSARPDLVRHERR